MAAAAGLPPMATRAALSHLYAECIHADQSQACPCYREQERLHDAAACLPRLAP